MLKTKLSVCFRRGRLRWVVIQASLKNLGKTLGKQGLSGGSWASERRKEVEGGGCEDDVFASWRKKKMAAGYINGGTHS